MTPASAPLIAVTASARETLPFPSVSLGVMLTVLLSDLVSVSGEPSAKSCSGLVQFWPVTTECAAASFSTVKESMPLVAPVVAVAVTVDDELVARAVVQVSGLVSACAAVDRAAKALL